MEAKKNLMTEEGLKKLQDELDDLKYVKSPAITKKIGEAKEQGDLSENAEYDAAMDEQGKIVDRIHEIEDILKDAEVIKYDESEDSGKINIGYTVKVLDVELNEEDEFKIVGSNEVDILNGLMSNESPLGQAIIGHEPGETVTVETEAGPLKYKILEAHR